MAYQSDTETRFRKKRYHESPLRKARVILFIEDFDVQADGVLRHLNKKVWKAIRCKSPDEALRYLNEASDKGELPDVVSIDLGLEPKRSVPDIGLELLQAIRKRWGGLPIIVHSSLDVDESVVQKVVAQGASYYYLRESNLKTYVDLLPYVAQGIMIFTQVPAGYLPKVANRHPDPFFDRDEWKRTIKLLDEGLTYSQIAQRVGRTERAIMARVQRMAIKLETLDEIDPIAETESHEPYRQAVVNWYRKNKHHLNY